MILNLFGEKRILLAEILTYHVVAGAGVKAADISDGQSIQNRTR